MSKQTKLWVLTEEYNDYDQYGDYFRAVWVTSPTLTQLAEFFYQTG